MKTKRKQSGKGIPLTKSQFDYIRANWGVKNGTEIANHLGISKTTVYNNAERMGLHDPRARQAITDDELDQMSVMLAGGMSYEETARRLGVTVRTVYRYRDHDIRSASDCRSPHLQGIQQIDDDLIEASLCPWDRPKIWRLDEEIERMKREILAARAREKGAVWEGVEAWEEKDDWRARA